MRGPGSDIMLTLEDKKFALTTESGDLIAVYGDEADARADGIHTAKDNPGTKVQLRELSEGALDGELLSRKYLLKETYPLPEEKTEKEKTEEEKEEEGGSSEAEGTEVAEESTGEAEEEKSGEEEEVKKRTEDGCCPQCGPPVAPSAEFCADCACKLG